jgi:hypothetical protein
MKILEGFFARSAAGNETFNALTILRLTRAVSCDTSMLRLTKSILRLTRAILESISLLFTETTHRQRQKQTLESQRGGKTRIHENQGRAKSGTDEVEIGQHQ